MEATGTVPALLVGKEHFDVKPLFFGSLLLSSIVTWTSGVVGPAPRPLTQDEVPVARAAAPVLTGVPKTVVVPHDRSGTMVTLTGDHFGPDVSVRVTNMSYTFTYGPSSLSVVNAQTLRFDAASLEDGTYIVSVRAGEQQSAALALQVVHK